MSPEQKKDLSSLLEKLRRLVTAHVTNTFAARLKDAERFRRKFQICGVITILCSVAIPFVAALPADAVRAKELLMSALALVIATLTGLTTFLAWGDAWRGHRRTHSSLVRGFSLWELKTVEVSHMEDYEKAKVAALEATRSLLEETGQSMDTLFTEYFRAVNRGPSSSEPSA